MTGKNLEIISQIVLWYKNSFRIDCDLNRKSITKVCCIYKSCIWWFSITVALI